MKKRALLLAPMGSVHRRFNWANIHALDALGYDVELCANFENGEGPEIHNQAFVQECTRQGRKTWSIPFERHSLSGSLRCLPQLKALLRQGQYDIVHTHTETGGLLLALAHSVKGNSRFIYTPHGMSFWKGSGVKSQMVYRPLERWICSGMDLNVGMNREEAEVLERWNPRSACYVHGTGLNIWRFNAVDDAVRDEFGAGEGKCCLIVSVGELDDNKNHIAVVRALAGLRDMDFKYVVCGAGPNGEMLMEEAGKCGVAEKVVLAGYRSDIPQILNAADVFVLPSFHEGMPVAALEAMACGLPVVCSEIRGNVDIVRHGENGFLFNPEDSAALSGLLRTLVENKKLRSEMGERNRDIVKPFSLEAVTEEWRLLYEKK